MANAKGMKVTTVRFSQDLWETVSHEAAIAGVSASQFVREAALARAAAAAGARGELPFATFSVARAAVEAASPLAPANAAEIQAALSALARAMASDIRSDSEALRGKSEQTRRQSRRIADESATRST
jgi:hypothetical protein